jgi:hypothetical protein
MPLSWWPSGCGWPFVAPDAQVEFITDHMTTRPPSRYRCLIGTLVAAVFLALASVLTFIDDAWCGGTRGLTVPCESVPSILVPLCLIGAAYGLVYTAYRAYRDFWARDYLRDLKRSGHI